MRHFFTPCALVLGSFFLAPFVARPAALSVNGTCEIGNCAAVDSISYPTVIPATPFSFTYAAGADSYSMMGTYTTSYDDNGSNLGITLTATYTGTTPSKTADTFNVQLLQNIFDNSPGSFDGVYSEHIPVRVGANGTFSGQLSFDGQSVGLIGPLGPGTYDVTKSANLTGLTGNTLSGDFNLILSFAAGTAPGTAIAVLSSVPEPAQTVSVALGLGLLLVGMARRRQYSWGRK